MNYMMPVVNVIGGGFAGIECALFLSSHGIKVHLFDVQSDEKCNCDFCNGRSKSEKTLLLEGVLRKELLLLGSKLIKEEDRLASEGYIGCIAEKMLAYGRELISSSKNIEVFSAKISQLNPSEINVIATGSSTDKKMYDFLREKFGSMRLFRQKHICPIVDNIDKGVCYEKGDSLYIPLNYDEYLHFVNTIIKVLNRENLSYNHRFIRNTIEELACMGRDAIKNHAMMPIYIENIRRPYAVVRLSLRERGYGIEGISSLLSDTSQLEIIRSIRGLEKATLLRASTVKDSVFINSRFVINDFNQSLQDHNIFFAGGILGIEDYLGAIASGLYTAMNVNSYVQGKTMVTLPPDSLIGELSRKITNADFVKRSIYEISYNKNNFLESVEKTCSVSIEKLFNRSKESLIRFKEVYTNGKYV